MSIQLQLRHDTAANWTSANPVLANGELGIETDTNKMKVGNGSTAWNSKAYAFAVLDSAGAVINPLFKGYRETCVIANSSTAYTFDLSGGTTFDITMSGNCTFTMPSKSASGESLGFIVWIYMNGAYTIAWGSGGGGSPTWIGVGSSGNASGSQTGYVAPANTKKQQLVFESINGKAWTFNAANMYDLA